MENAFENDFAEMVIVLAIDMCSSSKLISGLSPHNLSNFDHLLQNMYDWLNDNKINYNYEIYQFTGDGWILFFPAMKVDGSAFMDFLVKISQMHEEQRRNLIDVFLKDIPESTGLTFGAELGKLHQFELAFETKYVGHALNVACKLQDAVKQKIPESAINYSGLISRNVYNTIIKKSLADKKYEFHDVRRSLRNINSQFRCLTLNLSSFI